jgi:hypothetical protein
MWSELYKGKILIKDKVIGAIASNKSHLKKKDIKTATWEVTYLKNWFLGQYHTSWLIWWLSFHWMIFDLKRKGNHVLNICNVITPEMLTFNPLTRQTTFCRTAI